MSDNLKKIDEWLTDWLDDARTRNKLVPSVTEARDRVRWALTALSDRPDVAATVPTSDVEDEAAFALRQVKTILPRPIGIDFDATQLGINSVVSSTSSGVVRYVTDVGQLGSPTAHSYATRQIQLYAAVQRPTRVRQLIGRVMPSVIDRFDAAEQACTLLAIDSAQDTAAAAELRTLLEGVQGELFAMVRHWPRENMTWAAALERLRTSAPTNEWAYEQVVRQQVIHVGLRNDLSNVLKRRREGEVAALRAQVLDHVEALLNAVEFLRRSAKDADHAAEVV